VAAAKPLSVNARSATIVLMLDDYLPDYDVHEVHRISSSAEPAALIAAARAVTPREVPLMVGMMAIRSLPAVLRGRRDLSVTGSILVNFIRAGFVVLEDAPEHLVVGGVGRFWQASGGLRRIEAHDFRDFAEPGWAKAAFTFHAERRNGRSVLTTETRILGTDARAKHNFRRYWRVIYPGSAAIRVAWLRAIRRRAERYSAASASSRRSTSASLV
jgi:hypothetical protein